MVMNEHRIGCSVRIAQFGFIAYVQGLQPPLLANRTFTTFVVNVIISNSRGKCEEGLEPRLISIVYVYNVLCVPY